MLQHPAVDGDRRVGRRQRIGEEPDGVEGEIDRNGLDRFERQIATRTRDLAQFEKLKRIALLENEFTLEGGELTPTLKVKRRVIDEKYREVIDQIYEE